MMPSFHVCMTLVFLFNLGLSSVISEATPTYISHICTDTSTYTQNSTYQTNLGVLLSSLTSNATRDNGFYNNTVGQNPPNIVYGLFLCRGDLSPDVCLDCVGTASRDIMQRCTKQKVAIVWYRECMLRYSDQSIFSTLADLPYLSMLNTANISEPERFNPFLETTLYDLANRAVNDQHAGKKFAAKEANFTGLQRLYTLAQCTPDLTVADCSKCLTTAIPRIPNCCSGRDGGMLMLPSCNFRYEVYPFYNLTATPPTPTPRLNPPAAPAPSTRGITAIDSSFNSAYSINHAPFGHPSENFLIKIPINIKPHHRDGKNSKMSSGKKVKNRVSIGIIKEGNQNPLQRAPASQKRARTLVLTTKSVKVNRVNHLT